MAEIFQENVSSAKVVGGWFLSSTCKNWNRFAWQLSSPSHNRPYQFRTQVWLQVDRVLKTQKNQLFPIRSMVKTFELTWVWCLNRGPPTTMNLQLRNSRDVKRLKIGWRRTRDATVGDLLAERILTLIFLHPLSSLKWISRKRFWQTPDFVCQFIRLQATARPWGLARMHR